MKDFLLAEYKTIILVLLFCGGVYTWFYLNELAKADSQQNEPIETWTYTCFQPGKMAKGYIIGDDAPTFDNSWKAISEPSNVTAWQHAGSTDNLVLNVRNNRIRSIEFSLLSEQNNACSDDLNEWLRTHKQHHESLVIGNREYQRYDGVTVILEGSKDHQKQTALIVTPFEPPQNS